MISQNLSHKMLQKLSPQQIQLMKLLQIPTATLDQRIQEELEANPALDEGDQETEEGEFTADTDADGEFDEDGDYKEDTEAADEAAEEPFELDDYIEEYLEEDPTSYKLKTDNYNTDDDDKTIPIAVVGSFHDYLDSQIGMLNFETEREEIIAKQIIGSIDDDGYLRRDTSAILDDLMFAQNITATEKEITDYIQLIQKFDPPGTAARDLKECLILQIDLKLKNNQNEEETYVNRLLVSRKILESYFDEFSKKHYLKLQKHLNLCEDELRDAINEILKLNPKPASGFTNARNRSTHYVVADFLIANRDGELELTLNSRNAPDLRINDHYLGILMAYKDGKKNKKKKPNKDNKEAVMFIKQKIDSAKWFIDAIRQRQRTMYKTMYSIMQYQNDFFLTGDQRKLKPMILKDIADITGLDISTVSRVANSKFVQTEFGTKRLKDFFSESLQTNDGTEVSTLEVKNILSEVISLEDKKKPLSDEKLKNILREKSYNIARRTVAKYREQLSIPVARLRKVL